MSCILEELLAVAVWHTNYNGVSMGVFGLLAVFSVISQACTEDQGKP